MRIKNYKKFIRAQLLILIFAFIFLLFFNHSSYSYNNKSFVNVICTSPEAIIYALDKNILYNFTKKMPEVKNNIEIITNLKINALMDRLTEFFLVSENTNVEEYKKIMKIKKERNPT